jgi:hypothetical protein
LTQLLSVINTSGWNNSTVSTPPSPLRLPYRNSTPYAGSPPYGRSPPYGMSPPYSRSTSSNPSYRGSPHGYKSPSQDSYKDPYWRK